MEPDATKICFGLTRELDRSSLVEFLQLAGNREFATLFAGRLSSREIIELTDRVMVLIRTHLTESEYHAYFLQEASESHS